MKKRVFSTVMYDSAAHMAELWKGAPKYTQILEYIRWQSMATRKIAIDTDTINYVTVYFKMSKRTVESNIIKLVEQKVLIRYARGTYLINPQFIWSDKLALRKQVLEVMKPFLSKEGVKDTSVKRRIVAEVKTIMRASGRYSTERRDVVESINKQPVQNYKVDYGNEYE